MTKAEFVPRSTYYNNLQLNGSGGWGEGEILTRRPLGKEVPLTILVEYVWNNVGAEGESQMLWEWLEKKMDSS